jgi:hypothetical protein
MEPPGVEGIDIQTGGCAAWVTYIDGQLVAYYNPSSYEGYVTGSDVTFTVTLNGILTAVYKPSPIVGYRFGGSADATAPGIVIGEGGIVTDGSAPVVFRDAATGIDLYDYAPSLYEGYVTGGDALFVVQRNGVICVDYKPFVETEDGYVTDGDASYAYYDAANDIICIVYKPAPYGYICGGAADVEAILLGEARGGKGTPAPRRRIQPQRSIWLYNAHAYFDSTIQVGGEADCMFIPAKYTFIKSLPRLPQEELAKKDGEFLKYYNEYLKRKPTETFVYEPDGVSNLKFGGRNDPTFFDFSEWIVTLDDDYLIIDALSTEENPFITTTFDRDRKLQISREDDELLDILELL